MNVFISDILNSELIFNLELSKEVVVCDHPRSGL